MSDHATPETDKPKARIELTPRLAQKYPALVLAGMGFVFAVFVIFLFADWLAPYSYKVQDLANRLKPPVWLGGVEQYLLGTLIGFVAAHFRGWVEESIMMLVDAQASLPFMLIALAVLAFFGNSFTLFIVIMGINGWEKYARLTRGMVLSANTHGYAVAVRSLGARPASIYFRHILPNISSVLIVQFTLNFPQTILLETSLSFLGLGIQPPLTSLGQMLGSGRSYLITAWWIAVLPGIIIFLTTLSISMIGDWLRDRLDPTLRGR